MQCLLTSAGDEVWLVVEVQCNAIILQRGSIQEFACFENVVSSFGVPEQIGKARVAFYMLEKVWRAKVI